MRNAVFLLTAVLLLAPVVVSAQGEESSQAAAAQSSGRSDIEELSQKAANPIANLMSLPFQNNTDFGWGPYDRTLNTLNFQPVLPFADGKLITRTIVPFVWLPELGAETGLASSGLSDILFTAFYVPKEGMPMWGVGPVLGIPTGGEARGSQKWTAGPSAVVLTQPGNWTFGLLANYVWSFAGDSDARDVGKASIQYFIVYQLGGGWYVNSAPIANYDSKAPSGGKWRIPLGAGGGKLMQWGRLPVNLQTQAYYYVESPDQGPEWQWRVQLQFFLPMPGADH